MSKKIIMLLLLATITNATKKRHIFAPIHNNRIFNKIFNGNNNNAGIAQYFFNNQENSELLLDNNKEMLTNYYYNNNNYYEQEEEDDGIITEEIPQFYYKQIFHSMPDVKLQIVDVSETVSDDVPEIAEETHDSLDEGETISDVRHEKLFKQLPLFDRSNVFDSNDHQMTSTQGFYAAFKLLPFFDVSKFDVVENSKNGFENSDSDRQQVDTVFVLPPATIREHIFFPSIGKTHQEIGDENNNSKKLFGVNDLLLPYRFGNTVKKDDVIVTIPDIDTRFGGEFKKLPTFYGGNFANFDEKTTIKPRITNKHEATSHEFSGKFKILPTFDAKNEKITIIQAVVPNNDNNEMTTEYFGGKFKILPTFDISNFANIEEKLIIQPVVPNNHNNERTTDEFGGKFKILPTFEDSKFAIIEEKPTIQPVIPNNHNEMTTFEFHGKFKILPTFEDSKFAIIEEKPVIQPAVLNNNNEKIIIQDFGRNFKILPIFEAVNFANNTERKHTIQPVVPNKNNELTTDEFQGKFKILQTFDEKTIAKPAVVANNKNEPATTEEEFGGKFKILPNFEASNFVSNSKVGFGKVRQGFRPRKEKTGLPTMKIHEFKPNEKIGKFPGTGRKLQDGVGFEDIFNTGFGMKLQHVGQIPLDEHKIFDRFNEELYNSYGEILQ